MLLDRSGKPLRALDSLNVTRVSPPAFAGATTDARGDDAGANDPYTLFTVTGDVLVRIFGVCTVDLASAGGGTISLGITGNVALINAATTATAIDANEIWNDTAPAIVDTLASIPGPFVIPNGVDIVEAYATADITAGNIYYICLWRPLSDDGFVEAAV